MYTLFARKPDCLGRPGPAAVQLPRRHGGPTGIRRPVAGPVDVYSGVHRRDRACRNPRRAPRANRSLPRPGDRPHTHPEPGGHSPGPADHRASADQPVREPDQELLAGPCNRVHGHRGNHRRHFPEPDRPGDGVHDPRTAAVLNAVTADLRGHELV